MLSKFYSFSRIASISWFVAMEPLYPKKLCGEHYILHRNQYGKNLKKEAELR